MINFNDAIGRPEGIFTLNVFRGGKLIETYEDKNLVSTCRNSSWLA